MIDKRILEVLRQNDLIDQEFQELITSQLQPGQQEREEACSRLMEHSNHLAEMVHDTLDLLRYEEMTEIKRSANQAS